MKTIKNPRRLSPLSVIQDRVIQRAFAQLFQRSHTVTCEKCGHDLKATAATGEALLKLRLHSCPACGSRKFLYDARPETMPAYVSPKTEASQA